MPTTQTTPAQTDTAAQSTMHARESSTATLPDTLPFDTQLLPKPASAPVPDDFQQRQDADDEGGSTLPLPERVDEQQNTLPLPTRTGPTTAGPSSLGSILANSPSGPGGAGSGSGSGSGIQINPMTNSMLCEIGYTPVGAASKRRRPVADLPAAASLANLDTPVRGRRGGIRDSQWKSNLIANMMSPSFMQSSPTSGRPEDGGPTGMAGPPSDALSEVGPDIARLFGGAAVEAAGDENRLEGGLSQLFNATQTQAPPDVTMYEGLGEDDDAHLANEIHKAVGVPGALQSQDGEPAAIAGAGQECPQSSSSLFKADSTSPARPETLTEPKTGLGSHGLASSIMSPPPAKNSRNTRSFRADRLKAIFSSSPLSPRVPSGADSDLVLLPKPAALSFSDLGGDTQVLSQATKEKVVVEERQSAVAREKAMAGEILSSPPPSRVSFSSRSGELPGTVPIPDCGVKAGKTVSVQVAESDPIVDVLVPMTPSRSNKLIRAHSRLGESGEKVRYSKLGLNADETLPSRRGSRSASLSSVSSADEVDPRTGPAGTRRQRRRERVDDLGRAGSLHDETRSRGSSLDNISSDAGRKTPRQKKTESTSTADNFVVLDTPYPQNRPGTPHNEVVYNSSDGLVGSTPTCSPAMVEITPGYSIRLAEPGGSAEVRSDRVPRSAMATSALRTGSERFPPVTLRQSSPPQSSLPSAGNLLFTQRLASSPSVEAVSNMGAQSEGGTAPDVEEQTQTRANGMRPDPVCPSAGTVEGDDATSKPPQRAKRIHTFALSSLARLSSSSQQKIDHLELDDIMGGVGMDGPTISMTKDFEMDNSLKPVEKAKGAVKFEEALTPAEELLGTRDGPTVSIKTENEASADDASFPVQEDTSASDKREEKDSSDSDVALLSSKRKIVRKRRRKTQEVSNLSASSTDLLPNSRKKPKCTPEDPSPTDRDVPIDSKTVHVSLADSLAEESRNTLRSGPSGQGSKDDQLDGTDTRGQVKMESPFAVPEALDRFDCPRRVFARFRGLKMAFYPATCLGVSSKIGIDEKKNSGSSTGAASAPTTYLQVQFDDGTIDDVEEGLVRPLYLRAGELVKVDQHGMRSRTYVVSGGAGPRLGSSPAWEDVVKESAEGQSGPKTDILGYESLFLTVKPPVDPATVSKKKSRRQRVSDADAATEPIVVPVSAIYLTTTMWPKYASQTPAVNVDAIELVLQHQPEVTQGKRGAVVKEERMRLPRLSTTKPKARQQDGRMSDLGTPSSCGGFQDELQYPFPSPALLSRCGSVKGVSSPGVFGGRAVVGMERAARASSVFAPEGSLFADMVIAVTHQTEAEKRKLERVLAGNGCMLLSRGFDELFQFGGASQPLSSNGTPPSANRLSARPERVPAHRSSRRSSKRNQKQKQQSAGGREEEASLTVSCSTASPTWLGRGEGSLPDLLGMSLKVELGSLRFAGLVADRPSRKAKYVQALALGIPCISTAWVRKSLRAGRILPYSNFLLPAGMSGWTGGEICQSVPRLYGRFGGLGVPELTVAEMLAGRFKLLAGAGVVIVQRSSRAALEAHVRVLRRQLEEIGGAGEGSDSEEEEMGSGMSDGSSDSVLSDLSAPDSAEAGAGAPPAGRRFTDRAVVENYLFFAKALGASRVEVCETFSVAAGLILDGWEECARAGARGREPEEGAFGCSCYPSWNTVVVQAAGAELQKSWVELLGRVGRRRAKGGEGRQWEWDRHLGLIQDEVVVQSIIFGPRPPFGEASGESGGCPAVSLMKEGAFHSEG